MKKTIFLHDNFNLVTDNAAAPPDVQCDVSLTLVSQQQAHRGSERFQEGHTFYTFMSLLAAYSSLEGYTT